MSENLYRSSHSRGSYPYSGVDELKNETNSEETSWKVELPPERHKIKLAKDIRTAGSYLWRNREVILRQILKQRRRR
jgi:hypothetical protein